MSVRRVLLGVCGALTTIAARAEPPRPLAQAAQSTPTAFEVFVPPGPNKMLDALLVDQVTPGSANYHRFLSPAEYRARFATGSARMAEVAGALRRAGFVVERGGAHSVRVRGTVATVERAFAVTLADTVSASGRHVLLARTRPLLPDALARNGVVLTAFSGGIRMRRHSVSLGRIARANRAGPFGPYWVTDLKQAYDLPDIRALNGKGVHIGILMAGDENPPDMTMYFAHEGLTVPLIVSEPIYGGAAYDPDGSTETHLDIQQAGGMAPRAQIRLYNLPDLSDSAILSGLVAIDEENFADVVSMSFGAPEILYTAAYNNGQDMTGILASFDALFKQGNAEGITFVASSGDSGALAAPPAACFSVYASFDCGFFVTSVQHPASSPYVTAVGGTNLRTATDAANLSDLTSAYRSESAYQDQLSFDVLYGTPASGAVWGSGGGISLIEPKPSWQALAPTGSTQFRTVPDISGHMGGCPDSAVLPCPADRSADMVGIDGAYYGVVGTSASAPDIAGMLALKVQHARSRLGNVNADLYAMGNAQRAHTGAQIFRDQIPGYNGFYPATPGYNLVLGNGTPIGRRLIGVPTAAPAGVPLSASNP